MDAFKHSFFLKSDSYPMQTNHVSVNALLCFVSESDSTLLTVLFLPAVSVIYMLVPDGQVWVL